MTLTSRPGPDHHRRDSSMLAEFDRNPAFRKLVLGILAVSLLGWLYVGLELLNVVPSPVAHAATSSTTAYLKPGISAARHLPAWVHWRQAPGFMRDVEDCGGGPAVIVWGGHGDTSALICKSGIAETS